MKNYDGDTITVNIPDVHPIIGKEITIRVNGIDTPEMKGLCQNEKDKAVQAKLFVEKFCKSGKIVLKNINRDKYFRILADVYVNDMKLSNELIKQGLAVPYDGGIKSGWCE